MSISVKYVLVGYIFGTFSKRDMIIENVNLNKSKKKPFATAKFELADDGT